ncbi:hypothetical protein ACOSQ4_004873 [Xanthoceras sorbifolium]
MASFFATMEVSKDFIPQTRKARIHKFCNIRAHSSICTSRLPHLRSQASCESLEPRHPSSQPSEAHPKSSTQCHSGPLTLNSHLRTQSTLSDYLLSRIVHPLPYYPCLIGRRCRIRTPAASP